MKKTAKFPVRFLSVLIVACTIGLMSCADSICPTYIDSLAKTKNTNNPGEKGTIPSPYKYQARKKYAGTTVEYNSMNITATNSSAKI